MRRILGILAILTALGALAPDLGAAQSPHRIRRGGGPVDVPTDPTGSIKFNGKLPPSAGIPSPQLGNSAAPNIGVVSNP